MIRFNKSGINIKFSNGNKEINISFNKDIIKSGFHIFTNNAQKFVDPCYDININCYGLVIDYTNYNYNKIVHVIINDKDEYKDPNINKFITSLRAYADRYYNSYHDRLMGIPAFNMNFSIDKESYTYYITIKRDWLIDKGFEELLTQPYPDEYMSPDMINEKFPKFNLNNRIDIQQV